MASEVEICNQSLSWLGANPIIALDQGTLEADLCDRNYKYLRDAVLEEAAWTFATKRFEFQPIVDTPAYGYGQKFLIPSTVLRIIEASDNANFYNGVSNLDWRREEEYIVADASVIYAKCIIQITDPNKFSNLFAQTLAARLAAELAPTITESNTKTTQMWALYDKKIKMAIPIDNSQGRNDRVRGRSLNIAR